MIPVLVAPVVTDFVLVERMLDSLDAEVGRIVIVDNSLTGWTSTSGRDIEYVRPITGLGYPGGINAGICQTPEAPWWLFCNADLSFGPGDLATIERLMTVDDRPRLVTGSHRGLRFAYGAINRACVERVGLMDEWSFYPVYFDDDDYERRCRLDGGVDWVPFDGTMRHIGSTSLDHPDMARANNRTFPINRDAYIAKWGGPPGSETHDTPWGSGLPLWVTRPDPLARARRRW